MSLTLLFKRTDAHWTEDLRQTAARVRIARGICSSLDVPVHGNACTRMTPRGQPLQLRDNVGLMLCDHLRNVLHRATRPVSFLSA